MPLVFGVVVECVDHMVACARVAFEDLICLQVIRLQKLLEVKVASRSQLGFR